MITTEQRSKVDKIWLDFHSNGISTVTTVVEQFNYLIFLRQLDENETRREKRARLTGETYIPRLFVNDEEQKYRWHNLMVMSNTEERYDLFRDKVFPWLITLNPDEDSAYAQYMKDSKLEIRDGLALEKIMQGINDLDLKNEDSKGDLYEYMLSKMGTSGINGQFRTPRNIIKMMVALANPQPTDIIVDPAMGSAGFLVIASEYMHAKFKDSFYDEEFVRHYKHNMFHGYDNDPVMLRIGAMNMMLHGLGSADIAHRNSLAVTKDENGEASDEEKGKYTLVLANPPFKGTLDNAQVNPELLKITKSKNTELLFLAWFLHNLAIGGRAVVIVPSGVTFRKSNDYKQIRKAIIDENRLEAVISMPSGVFKPYSGVSTEVLCFTKTGHGGTDNVWFYDMEAYGISLDDKQNPIEENDIPDIIQRWNNLSMEEERTRQDKSFLVPVDEIRKNGYDLSINVYKETEHITKEYRPSKEIIRDVRDMYKELGMVLSELEEKL